MRKFRNILISIVSVMFISGYFIVDSWKTTMNNGDSCEYYMHVVSSFINHDAGDYSKTVDSYLKYYPAASDPRNDPFGIRKTGKGRYFIKYTLGVGVMEIPAFIIAHLIANVSEKYAPDGWSLPYMFCINFSKVFYLLIGFYFLIIILEEYFSKSVITLVVLSIAFGTNLFYHGTFLTLAHSFLFFDFCLLLYFTKKFYAEPDHTGALLIGLIIGLITLTRVPEIISIFIPLFWGVYNSEKFKQRIKFFTHEFKYLIISGVGFLLVFGVQIIYWYYVSGELIFNPYQGETFNFWGPKIHKGWFDFRNGWLIYTPIMAFSILGCFLLIKKIPEILFPVFCFVGLNAWIHYSYYIWNYYPGFGSRPMIECYPLLSFGLASFYSFILNKNKIKWISVFIFTFFTGLNLFQTWQMREGKIFSQQGSAAFYWETFGKMKSSINSLRAYDTREFQPESSEITLEDTLYINNYEDSTLNYKNSEIKYSGDFSVYNDNQPFHSEKMIRISDTHVKPFDWILVSIQAYRRKEDMVWDRNNLENLVLELRDDNDSLMIWTSIKIASHIGNEDYSIWSCGKQNTWGDAGFYVQMPKKLNPNWKIKVFVWNQNLHKLFLDDLQILHYVRI